MSVFSLPHRRNGSRWHSMRIGLLGGSFNPPHEGHLHISLAALKGLHLDCIWWLVSPQNPIKTLKPLPIAERLAQCRKLVDHPKILVTALESELGTNKTYQSVLKLKQTHTGAQFCWISGMDNALGLHEWNNWKDLLEEICMVHLTRSPARTLVKSCPYRMYRRQKHMYINSGAALPLAAGTTYWMMQKKMVNISSTQIRNQSTPEHAEASETRALKAL